MDDDDWWPTEDENGGENKLVAADNDAVEELKSQVLRDNKLKMEEATSRNLIFVGRTRAGKTTAYDMLCDPTHVSRPQSIFRGTVNAVVHPFTLETLDAETGVTVPFNINILDSPGLFEHTHAADEKRSNDAIVEAITTCLEHKIVHVHGIFFVASFEEGILGDDVLALKMMAKLFRGAGPNISLLVTRAENKSKTEQHQIALDIMASTELKPIVELCKMLPDGQQGKYPRIFFAGCLPRETLREGYSGPIETLSQNVKAMRTRLLNHIFKMSHSYDLRNLPLVAMNAQMAHQSFDRLKKLVKDHATHNVTGGAPETIQELKKQIMFEFTTLKPLRGILPPQNQDAVTRLFDSVRRALKIELEQLIQPLDEPEKNAPVEEAKKVE